MICDPTPAFLDLYYPPEFAQTRVHWVCDAIQPSHPLSPSSSPFSGKGVFIYIYVYFWISFTQVKCLSHLLLFAWGWNFSLLVLVTWPLNGNVSFLSESEDCVIHQEKFLRRLINSVPPWQTPHTTMINLWIWNPLKFFFFPKCVQWISELLKIPHCISLSFSVISF